MRIDTLHLVNFKCFEDNAFEFNPNFNLIIGENASGKTTLLEALKLLIHTIISDSIEIKEGGRKVLRNNPIHYRGYKFDQEFRIERETECTVTINIDYFDQNLEYKLYFQNSELNSNDSIAGNFIIGNVKKHIEIKNLINSSIRRNESKRITLPLFSYYDVKRRHKDRYPEKKKIESSDRSLSSLATYRSPQVGLPTVGFINWFIDESWWEFETGEKNPTFAKVKEAIVNCLEHISEIFFSGKHNRIVIKYQDSFHFFDDLSEGQKNILLLIGDISRTMIQLNPHLGDKVLEETDGIVLIDEIDLHLHPKWQRRIIGDLKRTFPKIQFIAATHSPFIIQSLTENDKLILLDGEIKTEYATNQGLEEIARFIMGVDSPEMSLRFKEMKEVAKQYFEILEQGKNADLNKKEELKERLTRLTSPYMNNPAYLAYLEYLDQKKIASGI